MQHPGDHEPVLMYDGADGFFCSTCGAPDDEGGGDEVKMESDIRNRIQKVVIHCLSIVNAEDVRGIPVVEDGPPVVRPEDWEGALSVNPIPKSIGRMGAEAVDRAFSRKMAKYAVEHIVEEAARLVSDGKTILATNVFRVRRDR